MGVTLSAKGVVAENGRVSSEKGSLSNALAEALSSAPKIKKAAIINLINHIHFTGGTIQAHIRNNATGKELTITAFPEPCVKDNLTARWLKHDGFKPMDYALLNILINNGKSIVVAQVETVGVTEDQFIAALPEKGRIWNRRQIRRFPAVNEINVEITQDSNSINGILKEFNNSSFCVRLDSESSLSFDGFDKGELFFIQLFKEELIYSGHCSYIKTVINGNDRLIVFAPENTEKNRGKRENRNPRVRLVPRPKIVFNHPILDKSVEFDLMDISSSGFSVRLNIGESPLMPGLFIKELYIVINGTINISCTASVIYQLRIDENNIKYGFSIPEMEMEMFNQLFAIICNAENPNVNLSPKLDFDSLWEFFFKSRFIYPKKYKLMESNRGEIRNIYNKLYQNGREIFAYITYQENGKIYGHCSIIRAYQRSWLIQHLAGIPSENTNKVGIHVVNQVFNYVDTMFKLPSAKMDYLMFYYRPENKFSEYFFGGLYKDTNNPEIISQNTFALLTCRLNLNSNSLLKYLIVEESSSNDLETIELLFHKQTRGELFIKSLKLHLNFNEEPLEETYKKIQLSRICKIYSLKKYDELMALLIVDQSDIGINMSELLNCIKIIIIDMNLLWEDLNWAINKLGGIYNKENISVMIYPTEYLKLNNINTDRYYTLWIIDSNYGYEYVNYLKQRSNPRLPSLVNYSS